MLLAPARVQALRAALLTRRAAACDALRAAADARRVLPQLRRLAQAADEALRALYALARLDAAGCALLAVGGYGRGALFPYSDVDVLLLLPESADENALRPHIEAFISACCLVKGANIFIRVGLIYVLLVVNAISIFLSLPYKYIIS